MGKLSFIKNILEKHPLYASVLLLGVGKWIRTYAYQVNYCNHFAFFEIIK